MVYTNSFLMAFRNMKYSPFRPSEGWCFTKAVMKGVPYNASRFTNMIASAILDDNETRFTARLNAIKILKRVRELTDVDVNERVVPNDILTIISNMATNPVSVTTESLRSDYAAIVGESIWQ